MTTTFVSWNTFRRVLFHYVKSGNYTNDEKFRTACCALVNAFFDKYHACGVNNNGVLNHQLLGIVTRWLNTLEKPIAATDNDSHAFLRNTIDGYITDATTTWKTALNKICTGKHYDMEFATIFADVLSKSKITVFEAKYLRTIEVANVLNDTISYTSFGHHVFNSIVSNDKSCPICSDFGDFVDAFSKVMWPGSNALVITCKHNSMFNYKPDYMFQFV